MRCVETEPGARARSVLADTLSAAEAEAFDVLGRSSPFAAYQQARAWAGAVPRRNRHSYCHYLLRDADRTLATALIRKTRLTPWHALAAVQRGPVVDQLASLRRALPDLMDRLREQGCTSLLVSPRVAEAEREHAAALLAGLDFRPVEARRQSLHVATGTIDLTRSEDAILAGFKQRARRQIKACVKAGATVRQAHGDADLAAYQRLLDGFAERHPGYDMRGQPGAAGQAALIAALGGAMLLSECDGRIIGGHAFVRQGSDAIWLSLPTIADASPVPRSYLLLWEAMRAARALGCERYDLAGLDAQAAAGSGEAGREQFKTAFAPERSELLPLYVVALRPLEHRLFFAGRQLWRDRARTRHS